MPEDFTTSPATRNASADALKGVLIFLVVLGHSIQATCTVRESFTNPLFIWIYSFHMPLLAGISGYFAYKSVVNKSFARMLSEKLRQLILPVSLFTLMFAMVEWAQFACGGQMLGGLETLALWWHHAAKSYWFLWDIFYCYIMLKLLHKCGLLNVWGMVVSYFVMYAFSAYVPAPRAEYAEFLYVFFLLGCALHKWGGARHIPCWGVGLALMVGAVCLWQWQLNYWVYFGYASMSADGFISAGMRLLLVGSMSVAVLGLWQCLRNYPSFLVRWGQQTLAIYLLQHVLLFLLGKCVPLRFPYDSPLWWLIALFSAVAITWTCYGIRWGFRRYNLTRNLSAPFFGDKG